MHETKQGDATIAQYFAKLSSLWQELDYYQDFQAECPDDAAKFQKLIEKERVYDFLADLQAEFDPIRVQVLGRDPFPSLREAYAYVQQEESRRNVMIYQPTFEKSTLSSTAASKTIKSIQNKGSDLIDKDHLTYDHCKDKVRIADGSMSAISGKATQKGYKCYHPPTKRVYVTMDVTFRECGAYYNASVREEKKENNYNDEEVSVNTPMQLWSTQLDLQKEFDVEREEQSGDGTKGSKENVEEENTESEREKQEQIHIDKTARENCGEWQVYTRRRKKHKTIMHSSPSQTVSSSTPVPNALQEPNQEHCEYPSHSFVDPSHSSYPIIDLTHSFDDLEVPIALRKGVRNKSKYPISDFVSYTSLSPLYRAFVSSLSSVSIPHNWKEALIDPKWKGAMDEEMRALKKNNTWELVDLPAGKRTVGCKWVFTVKYKADGSVDRFKARLVAKGFTQTYGIDYQENFAPVAKLNSILVLLSCAANLEWDLQQLDVKNAFLHGDLREEVYMEIPHGFLTQKNIGKVCRLKNALYGLKQSPRAWFDRFCRAMLNFEYKQSDVDHTMFIKKYMSKITILIVYVDDIVITENDPQKMSKLKCYLAKEFEIKDLGKLRYFLRIEVARSEKGIFISQRKYVLNLLQETGMLGCKPIDSPIEVNHRLQSKIGKEVDKERYQRLVVSEKESEKETEILARAVKRSTSREGCGARIGRAEAAEVPWRAS
uniref:Uncharacterized protein n=1 Tax=Ananas comosus var. bracteatus TaxID=296719 RepID=A0A6V7P1X4_ANACO|nr:unnamed protein product [Ananas comosus var. bracteatus]